MAQAPRQVHEARAGVRRLLADDDGFVGTGISLGKDGFEVLVLVESVDCAAAKKAPTEWRGVSVRVEATGTPRKL